MALTAPNKPDDVTTRVIAALEQLPQAQAIEALHYVEYLLDKYATAKKPRKRQPTKREDNPFLKMAGIASFEPYPDVQSLDKELYGL